MREKDFVEQNKEKWQRFESLVSGEVQSDPDEINQLYAQITNDLSFARTYYNKRSIRVYLNQLAQSVFIKLYKYRKGKAGSLIKFWIHDLPLALYRSRRELNVSLIIFLLSMGIGVFSGMHDPDFARVILGDGYVEMTEENIAKGQPMAVYGNSREVDMFFQITWNNIKVAFLTYVLGAFFAIGTVIVLLFNGVMVGSFQYFFVERDLFQESFLTIWMHGAMEISAIVIAGAAGLTLGRGLLFPGTLPRIQSFQIGARRSVKIMIGLMPVFMAAGFIEGFITRITDLPDFFRGGFILLCFALVGLYFWWFPRFRFRNATIPPYDQDHLIPELQLPVSLHLLRKTKENFTSSFVIFRKLTGKILGISAGVAVLFAGVFYVIYTDQISELIFFETFPVSSFYNLYQFHSYTNLPEIFFLNLISISLVLWASLFVFKKAFADQISEKANAKPMLFVKILCIVGLFELAVLSGNALVVFLAIFAIPFLMLWLAICFLESTSLPVGFSRMLFLLKGTKPSIYGSFLALGVVSLLLLFIVNAPFVSLYVDALQWNIDADDNTRYNITVLTVLVVNQVATFAVLPLIFFGQVLVYFSSLEAKEARILAGRVEQIGAKRSVYGMEKE